MEVGKLNKIVYIYTNSPGTLGSGKSDSFTLAVTTRGSLKKLSGNRGLSFGELMQSNSWEMFTRFQTAIETALRMDNKIVIDGKTFTIGSFEKVGEKRFYYRFVLNEQNS